ncbi:hypothetical protein SynBIOSE41_00324 [Synechococcus sp. BIOS-E4-1]|nr:hypothetical protein SynBIOSE41_00324 [Synechococcus sp. BIOS-E4-1]
MVRPDFFDTFIRNKNSGSNPGFFMGLFAINQRHKKLNYLIKKYWNTYQVR